MEILGYQLIIFGILVISGGSWLVTLLAFAWTVAHIFAPWLFFLQCCTIAAGWTVGRAMRDR